MRKVAVVEDDVQLNHAITLLLKKANYEVVQAYSCKDAIQCIQEHTFDILLLDVNLPDGEGFSICHLFTKEKQIPVIFLTARDEEIDIIKAYDEGCEDYIVKPFSMNVLLKRMEVVFRRKQDTQAMYQCQDIVLYVDQHVVKVANTIINVTPKEFEVLCVLMRNKNRVVTKELLLENIWDRDEQYVDASSVAVTISRLRKKLSKDSKKYITNVFGSGYRMEEHHEE